MDIDLSHYPVKTITGKDVHELPEPIKGSCRGCSFEDYDEAHDDYNCRVMGEDNLKCGEKDIVYVRPVKKHIVAYVTAKLSD